MIVVLCAIALVVLPVLWAAIPGEIANWHQAAALEAYLEGDLTAAISHMDDAIARDSSDAKRFLTRVKYRRLNNDLSAALDDCNAALELNPQSVECYRERSHTLSMLGKFDEAISDSERIAELPVEVPWWARSFPYNKVSALNGAAYFRALKNAELDKALEEVQSAIEIYESNNLEPSEGILDTRGYIYYLRGELELARSDLDIAVRRVEGFYRAFYGAEGSVQHTLMDPSGDPLIDLREVELKENEMAQTVAVLRYHRALVLDNLGETDLAEADYNRIRELGFKPNDKLF